MHSAQPDESLSQFDWSKATRLAAVCIVVLPFCGCLGRDYDRSLGRITIPDSPRGNSQVRDVLLVQDTSDADRPYGLNWSNRALESNANLTLTGSYVTGYPNMTGANVTGSYLTGSYRGTGPLPHMTGNPNLTGRPNIRLRSDHTTFPRGTAPQTVRGTVPRGTVPNGRGGVERGEVERPRVRLRINPNITPPPGGFDPPLNPRGRGGTTLPR